MGKILAGTFFAFLGTFPLESLAASNNQPLPPWLENLISDQSRNLYPDEIEESSYGGKRTYLITHADQADTGHEHVLRDDDGKEICEFGGFAGRVTSGSCDIEKIEYERTVADGKPRQDPERNSGAPPGQSAR